MKLRKVISGGQTGADQGGLAAALDCGLIVGGYVPNGYRTEQGPDTIPDWCKPFMIESSSADYTYRTRLNVEMSDATVIMWFRAPSAELTGGTRATMLHAIAVERIFFVVYSSTMPKTLAQWLHAYEVGTLNVAGPRASKDGDVFRRTRAFLVETFTELGRLT